MNQDRLAPLNIIPRAPTPPHMQMAAWVKQAIDCGEFCKPDEPIPSEKTLMRLTGVARTTVRRAMRALRSEGVIYTVKGRGSYVSPSYTSK